MKVLWFVNIPLPEASELMGRAPLPFGGWLVGASRYISMQGSVELTIAFPVGSGEPCRKFQGKRIKYFAFLSKQSGWKNRNITKEVINDIMRECAPDIVHLFGTELPHCSTVAAAASQMGTKLVVNIQGLVSIIALHLYSGLPFSVVYGTTLRNILRNDGVRSLKKRYEKAGKSEKKVIASADAVVGRTTWDKACTFFINRDARYFHCNETLRDAFYKNSWEYLECEKHTIIISQAHYPVKGFHFLLKALPLVLEEFPNTKVFVCGQDNIQAGKLYQKLLLGCYTMYLRRLIKDNKLSGCIRFTGALDEERMCKRFLASNVFVSCSSIENESNSLSEAKLLGLPCVVSYVGGVVDRVVHGVDGYQYQHDAYYMLAYYICEIFRRADGINGISKAARERALKLFNREANTAGMLRIYKEVLA